jgi:hypothetical protein
MENTYFPNTNFAILNIMLVLRFYFICGLFNDTVSSNSDYTASKSGMITNWKGNGNKQSRPNLWWAYYLDIFLEELRKTTKSLSQDRRSSGRDLNPKSPEYEVGMLISKPRHSMCYGYFFSYKFIHIATRLIMLLLTGVKMTHLPNIPTPQYPVLKHPQSVSLPFCQRPSFTPSQNNR